MYLVSSINDYNNLLKNEPLISLSNVSEKIKVFPYYYLQKLPGSVNGCFVREGVAQKLVSVAANLPRSIHLVILDGWRSYETQLALYHSTKNYFESQYDTEEQVLSRLSLFVSYPSKDPVKPAPHYTGGAVDLTLADNNGWLNMGTVFDEFIDEAFSDFFEKKKELTKEEIMIRDNRRMLRNAMEQEGFHANMDEWWHYDYGNLQWAEQKGMKPIYGGIQL